MHLIDYYNHDSPFVYCVTESLNGRQFFRSHKLHEVGGICFINVWENVSEAMCGTCQWNNNTLRLIRWSSAAAVRE